MASGPGIKRGQGGHVTARTEGHPAVTNPGPCFACSALGAIRPAAETLVTRGLRFEGFGDISWESAALVSLILCLEGRFDFDSDGRAGLRF